MNIHQPYVKFNPFKRSGDGCRTLPKQAKRAKKTACSFLGCKQYNTILLPSFTLKTILKRGNQRVKDAFSKQSLSKKGLIIFSTNLRILTLPYISYNYPWLDKSIISKRSLSNKARKKRSCKREGTSPHS